MTSEGNYNNVFPFAIAVHGLSSQRYQQVYSASEFTGLGPIAITGVTFRPDAVFGSAFLFTLPSVRIDLSTTAAGPATLDAVFAHNIGADDTMVLPTGPLVLSSSFKGPPSGPKDFDIHIEFVAPFLYDPNNGNLLLDVWNFGGGPDPSGLNAAFDSVQADNDSVLRIFTRADGSVDSVYGIGDSSGLVTRFDYVSIPEPSTFSAALLAFASLFLLRRRKARRIRPVLRTVIATALIAGFGVIVAPAQIYFPSFSQPMNSASYSTTIAPGSIFTIFGYSLGPQELLPAAGYPLPLQLGGTALTVISNGRTYNCPLIYVSNQQVAAILPSDVPPGRAEIRLTYGGQTGYGFIDAAPSAFGIYTAASTGIGPGTITGADYVAKTFNRPARPGEALILWGTGLGPIDGSDREVSVSGKQFSDVQVFVGNLPAKVLYAGRSGCCAGLDQIVFEVPAAPTGCFVPVVVRSGNLVSNFVTLSIEPAGTAACVNASPGVPGSVLTRALNGEEITYGEIALGPIRVLQGAGFSFTKGAADRLAAILQRPVSEADVRRLLNAYRFHKKNTAATILARYGIDPKHVDPRIIRTVRDAAAMDQQGVGVAFGRLRNLSAFSPLFAAHFTSVGTCTVTGGLPRAPRPQSTGLDAGSNLIVNGPAGRRALQRITNGQYVLSLGGGFPNGVLPAGAYTVGGTGGSNVGAFNSTINLGNALNWTNKAAIAAIDRSQPLTVTWSGGPSPGYILIAGGSHHDGTSTAFLCVEESRKGTFTIPNFVLSLLPPVSSGDGLLFIAPHPFTNPVSIPGVDAAYIVDAGSDYKALPVH